MSDNMKIVSTVRSEDGVGPPRGPPLEQIWGVPALEILAFPTRINKSLQRGRIFRTPIDTSFHATAKAVQKTYLLLFRSCRKIKFRPLYRSCCSPAAPAIYLQGFCNKLIHISHYRKPLVSWGGSSATKLSGLLPHGLHNEHPIVRAVSEFDHRGPLEALSEYTLAQDRAMGQEDWISLNVSASELQLCFTLPTGQSFRWRETAASEYTGVIGTRVVSEAYTVDACACCVLQLEPRVWTSGLVWFTVWRHALQNA